MPNEALEVMSVNECDAMGTDSSKTATHSLSMIVF